jgi:acetyl esterase
VKFENTRFSLFKYSTHSLLISFHSPYTDFLQNIPLDRPGDSDIRIDEYTETIKGVDNNDIKLHIYRPTGVTGPLPCLVYIHGGGMVIINTYNPVHNAWRKDLAATGMVCIGVDFRNAWLAGQQYPFPAGLNDCSSAVKWIDAHREELKITKIILEGESGGGNLSLATALKANKEGWIKKIDGVYAVVPYISGAYGWETERQLQELPSLIECDGYVLNTKSMAIMSSFYDSGKDAENPLAWPYFAKEGDLRGLPPIVITVDELDPLKDEGMAFYRNLLAAEVKAVGKMNLGLVHGAEMIFRNVIPEINKAVVGDIKLFADSI